MRALTIALALSVSGCALLPPPPAGDAAHLDQVLAAAARVSTLPPAQQVHELARARRAFAERPGDFERLKLATLLATLPAPLGNDTEAAALLAPLQSVRPDPPAGRFASLLAAQLAERQRLEQALHQSEQQADALQKKLDELNAIERKALRREEHLQ